jgi:hypothetical protein
MNKIVENKETTINSARITRLFKESNVLSSIFKFSLAIKNKNKKFRSNVNEERINVKRDMFLTSFDSSFFTPFLNEKIVRNLKE